MYLKFIKTHYFELAFCLYLVPCLLCLVPGTAQANNLNISNVVLTAPNATNKTIQVQFDIGWANSWRNQSNYDAAWVFVKYSTDSGTTWNHATLKTAGTNPSGVNTGSGTDIDIIVPTDKKGAFIQRSSSGSGSLSITSAQLVWDYNADGLTASSTARVKVFGIEMAYIPEGAFYAGDTTSTATLKQGSSDTDPWYIQSSGSISVTNSASDGYWDGGNTYTIPAAYPNGYGAFYLMKYEITQGQWVDFFNTLTAAQKTTRDITGLPGKNTDSVAERNTISWVSGDATTTRPDRAMNYLSWPDDCAFADWAGLRPMTELEFEKAARGANVTPTAGEYAWGSTTIAAATTISGTESGTETITTSGANSCYGEQALSGGDGGYGPLRVGIFATSTSTRTQAGAGYYGAMELSGNVWERTVTVRSTEGRAFTGSHGDGVLTATASYEGNATNTDWPGIDATAARGITGADGSGSRGGNHAETSAYLGISDRTAGYTATTNRSRQYGFRCCRKAS